MKRLISIIFLVCLLLGIAIFDQIYVNRFLNDLGVKSEIVSTAIEKDDKNLKREDVTLSYKDLEQFWEKSKNVLCYFTNYEKIRTIDESFVKLATAIKNEDSSLAIENIAVIKENSKFLRYSMGFSINNLF